MTTGKIEYSPDYKSDSKPFPSPDGVFQRLERRVELLRLQQLVVLAAKDWAKAINEGVREQIAADNRLRSTVVDLELFEANQKK